MQKTEQTVVEIFNHLLKQHPDLLRICGSALPEHELGAFVEALNAGLGYKFSIQHKKNQSDYLTELCDVYGSDKGELKPGGHPYPWPSHSYTDYYSRLFDHCRSNVTKVFECGLGTNNPALPSSMGIAGKPGASLRVWRDYFPNAMIYGADVDRDILFEEERIKTFFIDQLNPEAIRDFWLAVGELESGFDFMIDDGLHTFEAGSSLFAHSIDKLSPSGIYVIEDVTPQDLMRYKAFFSGTDYLVDYVTLFRPNLSLGDNNLVVVRNPSNPRVR